MFSDERKMKILDLLNDSLSITVSDLAHSFDVSESTIRRDLQDLEVQGYLKRTHGGAVALEVASFEPTFQEKAVYFPEEKSGIAQAAISLIRPGDTLLLDSGTTTLQIARQLPDNDITVITNSLSIARELSSLKHIHLLVLGGEFRTNTEALVGPLTELILAQLNVDKLFLGANGIDNVRGITTPNAVEAATKQAMITSAREVILVADRSKLDKVNLYKICDLSAIDAFITDSPPPSIYQDLLSTHDVQLIWPSRDFTTKKAEQP